MLVTQLHDDVLSMVFMYLTLNEAFVLRVVCRRFKFFVDHRCQNVVSLLLRSREDSGQLYRTVLQKITLDSDLRPTVLTVKRPLILSSYYASSLAQLFPNTKSLVLNCIDPDVNQSLISVWHRNLTSLTYGLLQQRPEIPYHVWGILSEMTKLVDLSCYGSWSEFKIRAQMQVLERLNTLIVENCPYSWLSGLNPNFKRLHIVDSSFTFQMNEHFDKIENFPRNLSHFQVSGNLYDTKKGKVFNLNVLDFLEHVTHLDFTFLATNQVCLIAIFLETNFHLIF